MTGSVAPHRNTSVFGLLTDIAGPAAFRCVTLRHKEKVMPRHGYLIKP
jgi:hypothetical protein